ncbi:PPC domain-containing DNA-binding protein [Mucilaginibacter calamicampi]|uniref:PPC domain-containing DNA-binding protein n=1 Tax=Mucilaginibacter calamicampi TaxID=1302352 RepID=A0ABW2YX96_9SPHI
MKKLFSLLLVCATLTSVAQVKPITAADLDYRKDGNGSYLLVLKRGQPLIASLNAFIAKEKLPGASITGLGAVENAEIAYYDLAKKKYKYQKFVPSMEVLSLNGNLGTFEGLPIVHAHVALADSNYVVRGGHVKEAVVSLILEITIVPTTKPITREWNKEFNELRTMTKVKEE